MSTIRNRSKRTPSPDNISANLPAKRTTPSLQSVSAPLFSTKLSHLIYLLVSLSVILTFYFSFRAAEWKVPEWRLALGMSPARQSGGGGGTSRFGTGKQREEGNSVEDRIEALARLLGIPTVDLAFAVAEVVKQHATPESLSALKEKQTGLVAEALAGGGDKNSEKAGGFVEGVTMGFEYLVGIDDLVG
jgi:hypothetical protein